MFKSTTYDNTYVRIGHISLYFYNTGNTQKMTENPDG